MSERARVVTLPMAESWSSGPGSHFLEESSTRARVRRVIKEESLRARESGEQEQGQS